MGRAEREEKVVNRERLRSGGKPDCAMKGRLSSISDAFATVVASSLG